jgi:hypothetical protein
MNTLKYFTKTITFSAFFLLVSAMAYSQKIEDSEIKKNVTAIDNSLEKLVQLEPAVFEYNKTKFRDLQLPSGKQYGFMAENLQTVFPDLVKYKSYSYSVGKNSFRTAKVKEIDVESIIPILVASIKEQQNEIQKLKNELLELKTRNSTAAAQ